MKRSLLEPRKIPRQSRSEAMVEAILEAAGRVLEREGLAAFTATRVAEVAGISVGSLYQYFPNKHALTAALIRREQTALVHEVEAVVAATKDLPLEAGLARLASLAVAHQYGRPGLASALDHEERRLPLGKEIEAYRAAIRSATRGFLELHQARLPIKDLDSAAADLLIIARALVEADADRREPADPGLERRVVRALMGYLLLPTEALTPSRSSLRSL